MKFLYSICAAILFCVMVWAGPPVIWSDGGAKVLGTGDIEANSITSTGSPVIQDGSEGTAGECLVSSDTQGTGTWDTCPGGGGGITGTGTDNRIMRWDTTTDAQDSNISVADTSGDLTNETAAQNWSIKTVNNGAGNSGSLLLGPGTATGTRGTLDFDAADINLFDDSEVSFTETNFSEWWGDSIFGLIFDGQSTGLSTQGVFQFGPQDTTATSPAYFQMLIGGWSHTGAATGGSSGGIDISSADITNAGSSITAGYLEMSAGDNSGTGAGGQTTVRAGNASNGGNGGTLFLIAGSATGGGNGANVEINAGTGAANGTIDLNSPIGTDILLGAGSLDIGSDAQPADRVYANVFFGTGSQPLNYRSAGTTQYALNTNYITNTDGVSSIVWQDGFSVANEIGIATRDRTGATASTNAYIETGDCVNSSSCGHIYLRAGKSTGTATDGIIFTLSALHMDDTNGAGLKPVKLTADPCGDTTLYPEGSIFFNDTSNYFCWCDAAGNDLQVHSPATACF